MTLPVLYHCDDQARRYRNMNIDGRFRKRRLVLLITDFFWLQEHADVHIINRMATIAAMSDTITYHAEQGRMRVTIDMNFSSFAWRLISFHLMPAILTFILFRRDTSLVIYLDVPTSLITLQLETDSDMRVEYNTCRFKSDIFYSSRANNVINIFLISRHLLKSIITLPIDFLIRKEAMQCSLYIKWRNGN
jgi:hypothetical protein